MAKMPDTIKVRFELENAFSEPLAAIRRSLVLMGILGEVTEEIARAREKHGDQADLDVADDGTNINAVNQVFLNEGGKGQTLADGVTVYDLEDLAKRRCQWHAEQGTITHEHIITEEWAEFVGAQTPEEARDELIQLAATAINGVLAIDFQAGK